MSATPSIRVQTLPLLVARNEEVQLLRQAYQRVTDSSHTCEAVLVAGDSGSGKTALVQHTFEKLLGNDGTIFASGKYEKLNAARPFSAIVDALTYLCGKTLQSENEPKDLKEKLQEKLGVTDLHIFCKLVPALATIIEGQEEHANRVNADIVENVTFAVPRFAEIVRSVIYTIASSLESPLILFLDDVQWADAESLSLITSLSSLHSACCNLLLILAYRDNAEYQMSRGKLVSATTGFRVQEIKLRGLDLTSTNVLISKTLKTNLEDTLQLSELIWQRTGGNVFHAREFLQMLHRQELLHYSLNDFRWEWNIKKIQGATNVTDNVAILLTAKVRQLSLYVQSVLQMAACLGFFFDATMLERIVGDLDESNMSESDLKQNTANNVLPEQAEITGNESCANNEFHEAIVLACNENLLDPVKDKKYKFSHDLVQQAVYEMIPAGKEKDSLHWRIGLILWGEHKRRTYNNLSDDWVLFTAADQLNRVSLDNSLRIGDEETRLALVRLNVEAGKKAFEKSAFKYSAEFFDTGVSYLDAGQSRWFSDYDLCLEVHTLSAEAEYIVGNFEKCEGRVNTILPNAHGFEDKLRPYIVLVESLGARGKIQEALDQAVVVLRLLGEPIPRRPNSLHVLKELVKVKRAMKIQKIDEVLTLPDMTIPSKVVAMKLLQTAATFSWFAGDKSFLAVSSIRMFWLTLKHGICRNSPYALAAFGIVVGILGDLDMAYEIGRVSLELLKRPHTLPCYARSISVIFTFLQHLKQPLMQCLDSMINGYHIGMKSGEIEGAAMCLCPYAFAGLYLGKQLEVVVTEIAGFRQTYREAFSQHFTIQSLIPVHQFALNMMGLSDNPLILNGDAMCEDSFLLSVRQTSNDVAEEVVHIMRMILLYIMNEVDSASEEVPKLDLNASRGTHLSFPFTVMYAGLLMLAMARKTRKRKYLRKAEACIRKMKKLAKFGNLNVPPNLGLLLAERDSLRENRPVADVKKSFDSTIIMATRSGFSVVEAIANERAGEYMSSVGDSFWAESYLSRALFLYSEWGATAKKDQLLCKYGFLAESRDALGGRFDIGLRNRFSSSILGNNP